MGLLRAKNLGELCLSTVDVSESTASALTLGLMSTDCLKILIFQRCRLSDQVIKLLAKGLADNATLRQLEVDKCQFAHQLLQQDEGFIQILASMNHHPSLINLKAVGIAWTPSSMQALCALMKRQQLKHLDLNCCMETPNEPSESVCRQSLAPIISSLPSNLSLQTLILSGNNLGDDIVGCLADALTMNSTLQELHLQHNRITDKGLGALAACLPHMKLHTLLLARNLYNKEASEQILRSLPHNTTLQVLQLYTTPNSRRITYYLNLNQAGRRLHAGRNVPISLWPLVLARINRLWASDMRRKETRASGIYGMLQEHPGVFIN
jgi:Ran GTPase-activating protein (RanGAP) involved in mRNA processing and transport